jgi:hypothetical protein
MSKNLKKKKKKKKKDPLTYVMDVSPNKKPNFHVLNEDHTI